MTAASGPVHPAGPPVVGPVVGLGELLWDLLPDGPACGGAPANTACQVAALGRPAAVASRVAADPLGDSAIEHVASLGVECGGIQRGPAPPRGPATGTVAVAVDAEGRPAYEFARDPAWDHLEWTPAFESLASRASAVVFGTLAQRAEASRRTIRSFLAATRRDCLRVFDVNLRQDFFTAAVIRESIALCDVLKLNREELPIVAEACGLTNSADPVAVLVQLAGLHELSLAALTLGPEGSILVVGGRVSRRTASAIRVVDTVGAGDAFTAGLVVGLLAGAGTAVGHGDWTISAVEAIHDAAAAAAARACGHRGAMPP